MKKAWILIAGLLVVEVAYGQGLGAGKQTIDIWASVYGSNTAATLSNVIDQVDGREASVGIDRGVWLIDTDILIPTNISLHVKRGSYFLLTNSALFSVEGEIVAGNQRVFELAENGGECLVNGSGGTFRFAYDGWFGSGVLYEHVAGIPARSISVENDTWAFILQSPADPSGEAAYSPNAQGAFDSIDAWLAGQLGMDTDGLNYNFLLLSNDLALVRAYLLGGSVSNMFGTNSWSFIGSDDDAGLVPALQHNQDIYADNFDKVNTNTYLTSNMFMTIVSGLLGLSEYADPPDTNSSPSYVERYSALTNIAHLVSLYETMGTNFNGLPADFYFSFPNLFELVDISLNHIGDVVKSRFGAGAFYVVESVSNVFSLSWTNGGAQVLYITNDNASIEFDVAPVGISARFEVWLKNYGYTNIQYGPEYLVPDTNAVDPGGKTIETLNRYYASPFSTDWVEERIYPSVYVEAEAPSTASVATVTAYDVSGLVITTNTYTNSGVIYETYSIYATDTYAGGSLILSTLIDNSFDYLVVGGGGGGGDSYGGGGGGGVVKEGTTTLAAGVYAVVIGKGGAADTAGGQSSIGGSIIANGGSAGATAGTCAQPGGRGGASGSGSGGVAVMYAGGGGAAAGSSAGGNASNGGTYDYASDDRGGNGAAGTVNALRNSVEYFGAGGGGGVWKYSGGASYAGKGGTGGGGRGGYNGSPGQNATGWGAGGGGGGPGAVTDSRPGGKGYGGIVILRQVVGVVE